MNIAEMINRMVGFFVGLTDKIAVIGFSNTPLGVISFLLALGGVVAFFLSMRKVYIEHQGTLPMLISELASASARGAIIWLMVGIAPVMLTIVGQGIISSIRSMPQSIGNSAAGLAQAHADNIKTIWYSQGLIQKDLATESPILFDGLQDTGGSLVDAKIVEQTLQNQAKAARGTINQNLSDAAILIVSKDPAERKRGVLLKQQATQAKADLDRGLSGAKASVAVAEQSDSEDDTTQVTLRSFLGGMSLGVSELLLLIKRCLAGGYSFIAILLPLLICIMSLWKLIQTLMEVFSYLVTYLIIVKLSISFGVVMAPVLLTTFWTTEWRKYGHAVFSSWLQMAAGTATLVVGVKIAIAGFMSLTGLATTMGSAVYTAVALSNPTISGKIIGGATAAAGVFMSAVATQLLVSVIQKSPQAGIGMISGSFHP